MTVISSPAISWSPSSAPRSSTDRAAAGRGSRPQKSRIPRGSSPRRRRRPDRHYCKCRRRRRQPQPHIRPWRTVNNSDRHGPLPLASSGKLDPIPDPTYRISRQATTVAQLYTGWFTGLGDKPSVVQMDRQFGTKWRCENKEKVFYSVRKTIIDHVEDRRRGGESLDTVLRHLQGAIGPAARAFKLSPSPSGTGRTRGPRKKKDEDWYEGPGTGLRLSFSLSFVSFSFLSFFFL